MPHDYCPCGAVLTGCSTIRSLKYPCLRLFMSIRTMKRISTEQKVCNTCRTSYYVWKNNNPEFGKIFSRLEEELSNVSASTEITTVNRKTLFFRKMYKYFHSSCYYIG